MNLRVPFLLFFIALTTTSMYAQVDHYIAITNSDGIHVQDVEVTALQNGETLPVDYVNQFIQAYHLQIDHDLPVTLTFSHPGYEFQEGLQLSPPYLSTSILVSAGREDDATVILGGMKRYFRTDRTILAVRPQASTWQNQEKLSSLMDLASKHGLLATPSPWPLVEHEEGSMESATTTYYFKYQEGKEHAPFDDAALEALRNSDLVAQAGIALFPNQILSNEFLISGEEFPPAWLQKSNLEFIPPLTERDQARLKAPEGCGMGILDLLSIARKKGYFTSIEPEFYY